MEVGRRHVDVAAPLRQLRRAVTQPPVPAQRPFALDATLRAGPADRTTSAAAEGLALHPPLRGFLDGPERPLLRRPADGHELHAGIRSLAPSAQGHGRPLDAARADLGRRARVPLGTRLLPVAEHRSVVWPALAPLC